MSDELDERVSAIGENITNLSNQINDQRDSAAKLQDELDKLNLKEYEKQTRTQEISDAHDRYKMLTGESNAWWTKFDSDKRKHPKKPTLQEQCSLAETGLECAWYAFYAAQARIKYMETFKRAYEAFKIQHHIDYATKLLRRSELATINVQERHNAILRSLSHPPPIYMAPSAASLDQFIKRTKDRLKMSKK